ncbi:hypothetical protein WJX81_007746 [Elliptochloris bilobata]|uniref:Cell division control protein 24 OB domain-containing protein n=1 Tax=Elliptochloris bilobata TaxID=381761 RepID=A0AAW1RZY9_9CHLO
MYTHIVERWSAQATTQSQASPQAEGRLASLAEVLAAGGDTAAPSVEARITTVEAANGRPIVLALQDASVDTPLGMYLHSRWAPLCQMSCPLLAAGTTLRIAGCRVRRAPNSCCVPPRLLPAAEMALVYSSVKEAMAALHPLPLCPVHQVLDSAPAPGQRCETGAALHAVVAIALDPAPAPGQRCKIGAALHTMLAKALDPAPVPGQRCEIGAALHAVVASVGAPQSGFDSAHSLATRTGAWRLVWLVDARDESRMAAPVALRLLDEQAAFGDILAVRETVLLAHPLLIGGSAGADGGGACFELGPQSLVGALVGHVAGVELRRDGRSQTLWLHVQAGTDSVEVHAAVDGPIRRHALALRPGHIAVLTGLRPLDPDLNPSRAVARPPEPGLAAAVPMDVDSAPALVWREEAPDAALASLSALPALLSSPAFRPAAATALATGQRDSSGTCGSADQQGLHLCEVELGALPRVSIRRAHAPCGRWLRAASLEWGGMFDAAASPFAAAGSAADERDRLDPVMIGLWTCSFCSVDCGAAAAPFAFDVGVELVAPSGRTAARVVGEPAAALLGVFPTQWQAWDEDARQAHLREQVLGMRLLVSLVAEESSRPPQVAGLWRLDW